MRHELRPFVAADLPALSEWLRRPHVEEWWGDPEAELRLVEEALDDARMEFFVLTLDGRPVGFGQTWSPHDWDGHPLGDEPLGTRGIDLSIGEDALIGRGHGRRFAALLADHCLRNGAPRVVIDPSPANIRAIRAYEAAGFRPVGERRTISGDALLMARDARHPT